MPPEPRPRPLEQIRFYVDEDILSFGYALMWLRHDAVACGIEPVRSVIGPAAVTDPDGRCPVCQSGEAIRQTNCTPRVEAWACDRCDTSWAISVVHPLLLARIAAAVAARPIADEVVTVAPDPRAQDDDNQPRGYYIDECGHRVSLVGAVCHVGPCDDCDPGPT